MRPSRQVIGGRRSGAAKTCASYVVLTLAVLASFAAVGGLVRNGGFDSGVAPKADGWSLGSEFKLEENCGLNGARGIHFKRDTPKQSEFATQYLDLRPGGVYKLSCYVKAKDLKGTARDGVKACALLMLSVSDANGAYLSEYCTTRVVDTKGEWVKLEGKTGRMPPNAAKFALHPFVWHQATGEAWFDEINVEEVDLRPVVAVLTDAYRNLAWEGDVTFRALLALDAKKLDGVRLNIVRADGDCGSVRVPIPAFTATDASITLPVKDFPLGKLPVSVEVCEAASGKVLASEDVMFERTASAPLRKCWIDRRNRMVVDGKPFFPLGCYVYNMDKVQLEAYAKGSFNCMMIYPYVGREVFDRVHERGIRIIATLKDCFPGATHGPAKFTTYGDTDRGFLSRFYQVKDHPAVIAWYLNDESSVSEKDRLVRQYRFICDRDDQHPAWSLLCQHDLVRDYIGTCDVIGTDPYPVNKAPIARAADWTRETRASFLGGPLWQVPQAFAWTWWNSQMTSEEGYMPTKAEMRSMAWQCVANGANGIVYYCFGTMWSFMKDRKEFDASWKGLCEISDEIARQFPVLLADEDGPTVSGFAPGTSGRTWRKAGKDYLLVVNETREEVCTDLTLSRSLEGETAVMGGDECRVEVRNGKLSVGLKPLACVMLELGKL